ncbi:hypothetical protein PR001_g13187 [Phytophthora rubi]|uniref:MULE transposase domain-containing protein n=1 Tax=Phytophthora rubi TaxID=129364 RepID=A0A6A3LVY3_9STRA|nr:hypothetical protein PR001_g13187 [Phytophthora rubi]
MTSGDEGVGVDVALNEVDVASVRAYSDVAAAHADGPVEVEADSCSETEAFPSSEESALLSGMSDGDGDSPHLVSSKRQRSDSASSASRADTPACKKRDGSTKLYINGYEFTRATVTQVKISYRCSYYRSQSCKAKLEFIAAIMDYDFANSIPHTCVPPSLRTLPDREEAGVRDVTVAMKSEVDKLATTTVATPLQIWDEVRAKYYTPAEANTVVRGMARGQVIKRVHHARALHYGADVHGRVEVPPLVNVKNTGMLFLQFHHVWGNTNNELDRVVGWANPSLLNLLRYENITLFVDGTFRCVPDTFGQCVVVMVYDRGTKLYIPVFFVLCTSKSYDTYWNLLQFVSNACGEPIKPKEVVCDFESALINAASDWFPQAAIIGCLFHFKQACKRRMLKYRLHKDQVKVAMLPGFLDMLTVIDKSKISPQGIDWVKNAIQERCKKDNITYSSTKWTSFWKYFERTWLKLLPPKFWNVHGYSKSVVARTNNPLERFNRELNAAFGTPHPSLPRFIQTVEDISRRRVQLRNDISLGRAKPPNRAERYELPCPVELSDRVDEGAEAVV